jgi:hypothetical protein
VENPSYGSTEYRIEKFLYTKPSDNSLRLSLVHSILIVRVRSLVISQHRNNGAHALHTEKQLLNNRRHPPSSEFTNH